MTFISVSIKSLPALTMLSSESIQIMHPASQCKGPSESTGDALGAVVMEDLQVDGTAGEAEHHKNPPFQCNFTLRGQDGTENICLAKQKWRLNCLEDVRDVCLERCEALFVEF